MSKVSINTYIQTSYDHPYAHSVKAVLKNSIRYNYNEDFRFNFQPMESIDELDIQHEMYDYVEGAVVLKVGDIVVVDWEKWNELIDFWLHVYSILRKNHFKEECEIVYGETPAVIKIIPENFSNSVKILLDNNYKATAKREELFVAFLKEAKNFFTFLWKIRPELKKELKYIIPELEEDTIRFLE